MKAKEYAEIAIKEEYSIESVDRVIKGLLGEITVISKKRKVGSTAALNGVVQEIRQKWRAISRRAEGLNIDGFDFFLIKHGLLNKDLTINTEINSIPEMGA